MAIKLRSTSGLGVIAMPHLDLAYPDVRVQKLQIVKQPFLADDIVPGNMGVAGIDASRNWNYPLKPLKDFRDLLKAPPERELGSGGVLDQNRQSSLCQVECLR